MANSWRDRFNRLSGQNRFAVCRILLHLSAQEVAPLLGLLNRKSQEAIASEGDLRTLGEGLVDICQTLLQYDLYWRSASNEGDVFWNEEDAADYLAELFTDSAERYGDAIEDSAGDASNDLLTLPVTQHLVVMLTVAYEGESPELETDLADMSALKTGLKALINLHYQDRLRAIQVHFSPAQLGDVLTADQLLLNFPELVPL
ncbi:DUF1517 domain-containing protein [Oscillatoria sp. FACHB-1407]|uniref:DUF1517 domain-containing protein n=1 Tax=Oscillatoria sp. FACHB-1407 TaxID=2692847 RepID=UPI001687882B|nr:DUF1517 domain-containing protein [Oscillatoria sp. FACHB-1407]MBD2461888.1 DUF1517 domain-containing protein [Oscillatoria sp. FACHB-1407]